MQVRFESSTYRATVGKSGVGYYSLRFSDALKKEHIAEEVSGPFGSFSLGNKIYRKLSSYNIAPAFDVFMKPTELTVFPNFDCWRTAKTKLTAVTIHDLTYLYYPELVEKRNLAHLRRVIPRAIERADIVITVSNSVKSELIKEFDLTEDKCIVTPVPPDESFLKTNKVTKKEVLSKFSIPTKKYIYFIGNLDPRKDLATLVKAYSDLPGPLKDDYSLVIAGGSGWLSESTQQTINSAISNGENILQLGYVDDVDVVPLMKQASLLVMPSLYEGFGMPITEAFACKTPVVSSDIPVLRETAGKAAIFAKAGDAKSFSKAIEKVLSSPTTQKKLVKLGTEQLARFSWSTNVKSLVERASEISGSR